VPADAASLLPIAAKRSSMLPLFLILGAVVLVSVLVLVYFLVRK
jgi:hypothetical protein